MSKGIYFRPFEKEDLLAIEPIEPISQDKEFSSKMQQVIEDSGLSVTGVKDGKPVICGGVHPLEDDQGEMWLRIGKCCLDYRVSTLRSIQEGLKVIEEAYPFKQLNATIKCSFKAGIRLVKFLGFHLTQTQTHDGVEWLTFSKRVKA